MVLNCELVLQPDATPAQLKALGAALARWFDGFVAALVTSRPDVDGWIDRRALTDLAAGELPMPFILRVLQDQLGVKARDVCAALEEAREAFPLVRRSVPAPQARSVCFGFSLDEKDRDSLLANLRRYIPLGVVKDVLVNGQSWRVTE